MSRVRGVAGLVAGAMMVLSSAAHSFVGWPQMRAPLEAAGAPRDLVLGLGFGWHFGGVAMLTFGAIVIFVFANRLRGRVVPLAPAALIAVVYLTFGAWALLASGDPFFLAFVVPGLLLAAACPGWATAPR
jgi:hypothetical protein